MKNKPAIYMDACCFIDIVAYSQDIQPKNDRSREVGYYRAMIEASKDEKIATFTSSLTCVECTHINSIDRKAILNEEVKRLFDSVILSGAEGVSPVFPTDEIIQFARDLNWTHEITCKPFDLLHLATAIKRGCEEFITTDSNSMDKNGNIEKLARLGLKVIEPSQTRLLPDGYLEKQTGLFVGQE